eukprot:CAMPEP_0181206802 /NCGR_PEP_ID=MMETSP1096-20121128/21233_1 /TAXON_ID=156174 ORGANISM="Chrysochromulina ericina, Strain CCMP281" /NCGR_SAMPLE_ID=MMETSP1096 /ASSEMBLY_ACC=CAM_ASM_000453 /LENGTH=87 /DNA_ID=CAMNT_0023297733 /DNA_START=57 /DNA_END=320 /DNA_ORIENTATION=-
MMPIPCSTLGAANRSELSGLGATGRHCRWCRRQHMQQHRTQRRRRTAPQMAHPHPLGRLTAQRKSPADDAASATQGGTQTHSPSLPP